GRGARNPRPVHESPAMFAWFARFIDPFMPAPVVRPPHTILAFYRHFLAPIRGVLLIILAVSLVASLAEMALYVFLADILERIATADPARFFADNWLLLSAM